MSSSGDELAVDHSASGAPPVRGIWSAWFQVPLQVFLLATSAFAIDRLALATASGAVRIGPGPTFNTEFIDVRWWFASLILCIPLWFFARKWKRLLPCVLAGVAVTAPQFWAFDVMVDRYAASEWSQGTEFLGIVIPVCLGVGFLVALRTGARNSPPWIALRRQREHGPSSRGDQSD